MTATVPTSRGQVPGLERVTPRPTTVGLVSGGLGAYWPQFPDLLPSSKDPRTGLPNGYGTWTVTLSMSASSPTPRTERGPPSS